jgi:hypothetical protein
VNAENGKPLLGPGIAGASGGTGLVAIVGLLPDDNIRQMAIYAAPTISIALTGLWSAANGKFDEILADRRLANELRKAQAEYDRLKNDPDSSSDIKKEMKEKVEALRLLKFSIHHKRVNEIVAS